VTNYQLACDVLLVMFVFVYYWQVSISGEWASSRSRRCW